MSAMKIEVDPDLQGAAEWMQRNIPAAKLVAVASGLASFAPLLWGQYQPEAIQAIRLVAEPIAGPRTPAASNE